jgi:hypothetical protein
MLRRLTILAASAVFAACAVTPYQPYTGGVGYSEVNTARNRYEVVYHGTTGMDEATAKNYAIVRAAEIGRENGMTHFRIARSRQDALVETTRDPDLFPRRPWTGEPRRMTEWEWRREQELEESRRRLTVREERAPVVTLIVDYLNEDCKACLSVEAKLREADEQGIRKDGSKD